GTEHRVGQAPRPPCPRDPLDHPGGDPMNIDERLRSSLQTVAREVSVTPEELVHAEHRFVHRREQATARRRWSTGLVAAAAVGALVLAGVVGWRELQETAAPQPAAPVPEPVAELPLDVESLAGLW